MASIRDMMNLNQANFATAEKDLAKLTEKIMGNQKILKLLYYNTVDCLTKTDITDDITISKIAQDNIRIIPKLDIPENEGSYIMITFDQFSPNGSNPEFMDNLIIIDVLCPVGLWIMDDYMLRPYKIMHELNDMLDKRKLNGIGKINLVGANLLNLGDYTGYQLAYSVINDV